MMDPFRKRFLRSPGAFLCLFGSTIKAMLTTLWTGRGQEVSPALAEKLMLAVSGVNECVYCSYLHTKTALEAGISEEEIGALLRGSVEGFSEEEVIGITYAQHWAESGRKPSSTARQRVVDHYGEGRTRRMELFMTAVYLGNLCSNTVEAYKRGAAESGKVCLFLTYLLCAPIAFFIRRSGRRPGATPPEL